MLTPKLSPRWTLLISFMLVSAPPAASQHTDSAAPHRFWEALSLGNATASLACSICADISDRSIAAAVTAGVRRTPRIYIGGQLDGWYRYSGGQNERLYVVGPVMEYYPSRERRASLG